MPCTDHYYTCVIAIFPLIILITDFAIWEETRKDREKAYVLFANQKTYLKTKHANSVRYNEN